ncbi:ankyrin repeat-containing domain protein [Schizophyllum commune]
MSRPPSPGMPPDPDPDPGLEAKYLATSLWPEAVKLYEKTNKPLAELPKFNSTDELYVYVERSATKFKEFREDSLSWMRKLRSKIEPVACIVQTLSGALGDAVSMHGKPYSPMKAVFTAIGVVVETAMKVKEDFDDILTVFDTIDQYLRIIAPLASSNMHEALRGASVKLLAQILNVFGVIGKTQKEGRMKHFIKKLAHGREVPDALKELGRLASTHHQMISAVTLDTVRRMMSALGNFIANSSSKQDATGFCLGQIKEIVQEIQRLVFQTSSSSMEQMLDDRKVLERIRDDLFQILNASKSAKKTDDLAKIYKWLSYPDSSVRMNDVLDTRVSGTGSWFLNSPELRSFQRGGSRVLWLHGSGRWLLVNSSWIRRSQMRNTSLWRTSSTLQDHALEISESSYQRFFAGSQVVEMTVAETFSGYMLNTTMVIHSHSLDEADDDSILAFLQELRNNHDHVCLLVSSRTEVPYRQDLDRLADTQVISNRILVKDDIAIILDCFLADTLDELDSELANHVRKTLTDGSEGNYRWTVLQSNELANYAGLPSVIETKLKSMPRRLRDIYDRAAANIPEDQIDTVRLLLAWTLHSASNLKGKDLAELLAFRFSGGDELPTFDKKLRPKSSERILKIINSTFLSWHGDSVYIAHNSVRDYLLDKTSRLHMDESSAHLAMTQMCLSYLIAYGRDQRYLEFQSSAGWIPSDKNYPLRFHAEQYCCQYADLCDEDDWDILERNVAQFIACSPDDVVGDVLHYAIECDAHIDGPGFAFLLINSGGYVCKSNPSPIFQALSLNNRHSLALLHLLVERGANPNANAIAFWDLARGTPLHYATKLCRKDFVATLLAMGADPNVLDGDGCSPLFLATQQDVPDLDDCLEIARMLIDHGALRSPFDDNGNNVHLRLALLVFDHRGDYAHSKQTLEILGIDLYARKLDGSTLLHFLLDKEECGHLGRGIIASLVNEGIADTNARNNELKTPLHVVAQPWHIDELDLELARILLTENTDTNIPDSEGKTALWYVIDGAREYVSCHHRDRDMCREQVHRRRFLARMLTARGADINRMSTPSPSNTCLLHRAMASNDDIEIFKLLLLADAAVGTRNEKGDTPLDAAIRRISHADAQYVLASLDAGADVNARAKEDGATPLHLAIQRLIEQGIHPGTSDLVTAVRRLVEQGAEVNAMDTLHRTPLHLLAQCSYPLGPVMELLLSKGANVNAQDSTGQTALHFACKVTSIISVIYTLFKAGANPYIRDHAGRLPDLPSWALALVDSCALAQYQAASIPQHGNATGTSIELQPPRESLVSTSSTSEPQPLSAKDMTREDSEGDLSMDVQIHDSTMDDRPSAMDVDEPSSAEDQPPRAVVVDVPRAALADQHLRSGDKRAREGDDDRPPMSPGERARREGAFEDWSFSW